MFQNIKASIFNAASMKFACKVTILNQLLKYLICHKSIIFTSNLRGKMRNKSWAPCNFHVLYENIFYLCGFAKKGDTLLHKMYNLNGKTEHKKTSFPEVAFALHVLRAKAYPQFKRAKYCWCASTCA